MSRRAPDQAATSTVPRRGRPLHRRARRGVRPPLRGAQGDARPGADLRALLRADEAREAQALGRSAPGDRGIRSSGVSPPRATSSDLTRDQAREGGRAQDDPEAESTARRSRSGCCGRDRERARPRPGERSNGAVSDLTEEELTPLHPEGADLVREAVACSGPRTTPTSIAASVSASTSWPPSAPAPRLDGAACEQAADRLFRARPGSAWPRRSTGM